MSFFDRLFALRQNEFRTPLEDFLTELFAEWLRQVTLAGRVTEVLTDLFKLAQAQLGESGKLNSIVWETQHVIGPGDHGAEGKRPDLIGRRSNFYLIIESKIAAGFTQYRDRRKVRGYWISTLAIVRGRSSCCRLVDPSLTCMFKLPAVTLTILPVSSSQLTAMHF